MKALYKSMLLCFVAVSLKFLPQKKRYYTIISMLDAWSIEDLFRVVALMDDMMFYMAAIKDAAQFDKET